MSGALTVGVACGQCGDEVYMFACPEHHWAVASICRGCGLANRVEDGTCKECAWPWRPAVKEVCPFCTEDFEGVCVGDACDDCRAKLLDEFADHPFCPHCFTVDPGDDYCGSCGERL